MRTHMNAEELEASHVLDQVKIGRYVPDSVVNWALRVLGDGIGLIDDTSKPD